MRAFALSVAALLAACDPAPRPPDVPEEASGDYPVPPDYRVEEHPEDSLEAAASPCGKACENLRAVGCSDGYPKKGVTCYRGCLSMARQQLVPARCWREARSVDAARACGLLRCSSR